MKTLRLAFALFLTVVALTSPAGAAAPEFIVQPSSLSVASGDPAVLACDAAGSPSPTLQWRRNDLAIAGATARKLVVSSAGPEHAGNYTCTATSSAGTTTSAVAVLSVLDSANSGRLVNLSIRTNAGTGAETLITGFAVGGTGVTGSKPLLLRGIGPSLAQFGVSGVLRDPMLTVYSGADATAMNDDWAGNAQIRNVTANVGAFALAGDAAKDCAIYAPATAIGSHTAQISCRDGSSGMVLAEIYDATPGLSFSASSPRLINVSARARVGTSSDILIAGFVIGGDTAKTLLIRAVGPTLSSFGVTGVLLDPELEVYAGARRLSSNDDWGNDAEVAHAATLVGGFPLGNASKDAAILITLSPGNYTAQVRGVGTATGVGLVELYEVPASPSWPIVSATAGFVLIPAGTFTMGGVVTSNPRDPREMDGHEIAFPHPVTLTTSYYYAKTETTWAEWRTVRDWAVTHGYADLASAGAGKADTHPVHSVSWYDVVKWLNAKSEMEGLVPVYYTNDAQTTVYRAGNVNVTIAQVKWTASGYRLPTEAEWEYAARGGRVGLRFPWGDTITHQQANYLSSTYYEHTNDPTYDVSATRGYHPTYATGGEPYTSPVGSFAANGYGLFDTSGNVYEWVWDEYGSADSVAVTDPRGPGPGTGSFRRMRGGCWLGYSFNLRCAQRNFSSSVDGRFNYLGFRQARNVVP